MTLHHIVAVLGGELYQNGARALIPAPNHSPSDRSVSLLLTGGRIVVHTFGGSRWQDVIDELRARGLIDARNTPTSLGGGSRGYHVPQRTERERSRIAQALFLRGRPAPGTLSETHARLRHIRRALPGPKVLRHSEAAPLSAYAPSSRSKPATMLAIVDPEGQIKGIELTYLDADGRRAARLHLPRKTIGVIPAGSSVTIDPAAPEMLVGEGVFTTLSASERFSLPAHALLSIRNMRDWAPPEGVRSVLVAGDNGRWGRAAAWGLAERLRANGLKAAAKFPPSGVNDWNDLAQAEAVRP